MLWKKNLIRSKVVLIIFPILAIFTGAALYEIIEWLYAVGADPEAGLAMLGSQDDIWDAQKDMLADGSGAVTSMILFVTIYWQRIKQIY